MVSALAIFAGFTLTSDLQAQQGRGRHKEAEVRVQQSVGFSVRERQIVAEFFTSHRHEVEALPPGIAKRQIPSALQALLPTRVGVEVSIFGDRIVLLEASGLVVDILDGIFR
jgi:hypothetical protein